MSVFIYLNFTQGLTLCLVEKKTQINMRAHTQLLLFLSLKNVCCARKTALPRNH